MICPKCQAEYDGDACPNCGKVTLEKPDAAPEPEAVPEAPAPAPETPAPEASIPEEPVTAPEPEAPKEPLILYIVLAAVGTLVLAVMSASMLLPKLIMEESGLQKLPREESAAFSLPDDVREQEQERKEKRERRKHDEDGRPEKWGAEAGVDYYSYYDAPFKVGEDLPAGRYLLISKDYWISNESEDHYGDFTYTVYATYTMTESREIGGGWAQNTAYVDLEDGQALDVSFADLWPADSDKLPIVPDPFEKSGMFLVGQDVEPGTYVVESYNDQYSGMYYIYDTIPMYDSDIIAEDYIGLGYEQEITLEEGQVLVTNFCRLKQ